MSFLYGSAYFLEPLNAASAYFLPSHDLLTLVVVPTLVEVAIGVPVIFGISEAVRRWFNPVFAALGAIFALSILILIALKGVMAAAAYDWQDRAIHGPDLATSLHRLKVIAFLASLGLVWGFRSSLYEVSRILSSLGYAFCALAIVQVGTLSYRMQVTAVASPPTDEFGNHWKLGNFMSRTEGGGSAAYRKRRVIWVIFDETDFSRLYGDERLPGLNPTNFERLARNGVFATHANSPASATIYSLPALLTGTPIGGAGVQIDKSTNLSVERLDTKWTPFDEATSIFGALAAEGLGASVLGFYHPYCKLFKLERCDSFAWPKYGGWSAALWANIPDSLVAKVGGTTSMESITRSSLQLLPQYVQRDDALTFVHLNFPHLPADYADKLLHVPYSSNPLIEYSHNLMLADRVLGEIMDSAERRVSNQDELLVISTDHWFRNAWYQAEVPETSRVVPFIVWKVGEHDGIVLPEAISTVNTAAMILDYLNGKLDSQRDIAAWWAHAPVYPSFIAPSK